MTAQRTPGPISCGICGQDFQPQDTAPGDPLATQHRREGAEHAWQAPPASVRSLDAVRHHQVGVQQRITLPGRPMVKPNRQSFNDPDGNGWILQQRPRRA
jgi:hypothetical protein